MKLRPYVGHLSNLLGLILLLFSCQTWAQTYSRVRMVRLSFVDGMVTVQRPDVQEWATAPANLPVSEGFKLAGDEAEVTKSAKLDQFGHIQLGGIGERLSKEIEKRTGFETRVTVLGHIQRGGSPTAFDRVLGSRYGIRAVDLIEEGKFGMLVIWKGNEIASMPLAEALTKLKYVDPRIVRDAEVFFA